MFCICTFISYGVTVIFAFGMYRILEAVGDTERNKAGAFKEMFKHTKMFEISNIDEFLK